MIDTELLKEKVLDLAMRGKLVEQDPADGNARDLLEEIQAEREQLIKEKKIKKTKTLPPISEDKIPYEIPESWEWVRAGELLLITMGQSPKKETINSIKDGYEFHQGKTLFGEKYLQESDVYTTAENKNISAPAVVMSVRAPVGDVNLIEREIFIGRGLASFQCFSGINIEYIYYFLSTLKKSLEQVSTGSTFKAINSGIVNNIMIPVPTTREQQRIVTELNRLYELIDQLFTAEQNYKLYSELVSKKTLDFAIQGKLVPQLPEEGTASTLLEEVAAERQRLVDEKKIKKTKPLPEITQEEIPYEIPESWEWVRLGSIIYPQKTVKEKPKEFYYIDISSINNELQKVENPELISAEGSPSRASKYVEEGDVVFSTVRPYLKNIAIVTSEYKNVIASTGFYVMCGIGKVNNEFLYYLSQSEYFLGSVTRMMRGDNSPSVRNNDLEEFVIPLPPADEQVRIVNKLKEIRQNI